MYYANQTNLANRRQSFYWPTSTSSFSIPTVKSVLPPLMSFSLTDNPLMDRTIAYRGFVCKHCLRICIMPVWGFRETEKILEPTHDCGELSSSVTYSKNAFTDINIVNQKLLEDLKSVVNKWTNNKPCLVANLRSKRKDLTDLTMTRQDTWNWAIRTVNEGQTILSDAELLDFLKLSGYRTYSHFGFNYQKDAQENSYLMHIRRSPPS